MNLRFAHTAFAAAAMALLLAAGQANADFVFTAQLDESNEVSNPPVPEQGSSGTGTFVLNDAMTRLTYDVTLVGLDLGGMTAETTDDRTPLDPNDNVTRVHFHRAPTGQNGGIVYGIIDGSPTLRNDNNPNDLVVDIAQSRITGAWDAPEGNGTTLTLELDELFGQLLYFNVHTADHAGGEIRGQVVPEPATLGLTAAAGLLLAARRRRRH